jgi:hypothetical protein
VDLARVRFSTETIVGEGGSGCSSDREVDADSDAEEEDVNEEAVVSRPEPTAGSGRTLSLAEGVVAASRLQDLGDGCVVREAAFGGVGVCGGRGIRWCESSSSGAASILVLVCGA